MNALQGPSRGEGVGGLGWGAYVSSPNFKTRRFAY